MTTVRAKFDGRAFVPDQPVSFDVGQSVTLSVTPNDANPSRKRGLARLVEIAEQLPPDPDSPTDAAAQHDHYLYGTPKRENP